MKRSRFSDEQIIGILQELEAGAMKELLAKKWQGLSLSAKLSRMRCTAGDCKAICREGACKIVGADRKMIRYQSCRPPEIGNPAPNGVTTGKALVQAG